MRCFLVDFSKCTKVVSFPLPGAFHGPFSEPANANIPVSAFSGFLVRVLLDHNTKAIGNMLVQSSCLATFWGFVVYLTQVCCKCYHPMGYLMGHDIGLIRRKGSDQFLAGIAKEKCFGSI